MKDFFITIQKFLLAMGVPLPLQICLLAMLPITEHRVAIPFGIFFYKLTPIEAFFWGSLGNLITTLILIAILEPVSNFLMSRSKFFNKLLTKIFEKTHHKHGKKFERYGTLFLTIFVAIPLPGSGAWTGALLSFLFGIKRSHAIAAIAVGIFIAGALITLGAESAHGLMKHFTK